MLSRYFPRCPVSGPVDPPVPYGHLVSRGAIPTKCASCSNLFEGECTRESPTAGYMALDHGPCPVEGPTDPVFYEDRFITSKVEVPRKCATCASLKVDGIRGFICGRGPEVWGDFPRGLDWGSWAPTRPTLVIPPSVQSSRDLTDAAIQGDRSAFLRIFRSLNPNLPLDEGRRTFEDLRRQVTAHEDQHG